MQRGAVMIHGSVAEVFENDASAMGMIGHGYTYSAHPVGAAAALACVPLIKKMGVADNAAARGEQLLAGGKALAEKYDVVGDVRGKGLMFCMEMVADRTTKTPLDKESIGKIFSGAYDAGVMVRISGNNLICSPPLIITEAETQNLLDGIESGLRAATANG